MPPPQYLTLSLPLFPTYEYPIQRDEAPLNEPFFEYKLNTKVVVSPNPLVVLYYLQLILLFLILLSPFYLTYFLIILFNLFLYIFKVLFQFLGSFFIAYLFSLILCLFIYLFITNNPLNIPLIFFLASIYNYFI